MPLAQITVVRGRGVPVPGDDVDTDRIIPARFMKCVTFDGLGAYAFHDVRFDEDGNPKGHPFDDPRFRGASVLVAGRNFGCGSSREHAPQSLYYAGIHAILAEGFAEIFFGNCTTLGIPCVRLEPGDRAALVEAVSTHAAREIEIDLRTSPVTVRFGEQSFQGAMPEGARQSLVAGQWDALGLLLDGKAEAARTAARLPKPPS